MFSRITSSLNAYGACASEWVIFNTTKTFQLSGGVLSLYTNKRPKYVFLASFNVFYLNFAQ